MDIKQAQRRVGYSITTKQLIALAASLALDEPPWTAEQVEEMRAARPFSSSLAGKQIRLSGPEFEREAAELGLTGPPWVLKDIDAVRFKVTPNFPGMTTETVAERLGVLARDVRRYARQFNVGRKLNPGCYVVGGERKKFGGSPRSYSEADLEKLRDILPPTLTTDYAVKVPVTRELRQRAAEIARERGGLTSAEDVLAELLERAGQGILGNDQATG